MPWRPWAIVGYMGYRDHGTFPGGVVLEDDGSVKTYYGAAYTAWRGQRRGPDFAVEALATTSVEGILDLAAWRGQRRGPDFAGSV